jgi:hypothetical protein
VWLQARRADGSRRGAAAGSGRSGGGSEVGHVGGSRVGTWGLQGRADAAPERGTRRCGATRAGAAGSQHARART